MKLGRPVKHTTRCHICGRSLSNDRGRLQHLNTWHKRNTANLNASNNKESDENSDNKVQEPEQQHEDFYCTTVPGRVYQEDLEEAYHQIVSWRKNIFMVPAWAAGKKNYRKQFMLCLHYSYENQVKHQRQTTI